MGAAPKAVKKGGRKTARKRDTGNAALVQQTALVTGKTTNYVQKVLRDERTSEEVMTVYLELRAAWL